MKTILVVDDEPTLLGVVTQALRDEEYHVVTARDGAEALEVADREHPDLILMDVMMPRLDGRDAVKRLREHDGLRGVPVVLMSAGVMASRIEPGIAFLAQTLRPRPPPRRRRPPARERPSGRRSGVRAECDRPFPRDNAEMAEIEGEHLAAVALGARDHGGVGETQPEIAVPVDQGTDARQIDDADIQHILSLNEIVKEGIESGSAQTPVRSSR